MFITIINNHRTNQDIKKYDVDKEMTSYNFELLLVD